MQLKMQTAQQTLGLQPASANVCQYQINPLPEDQAIELPASAQFLQNSSVIPTIFRQCADKTFTLTSEPKKVSIFEVSDKQNQVKVQWLCDLKDALRE
jgi:hypothetical protein